MTSDEEIQRFVSENRELVERMMKVQMDNFENTEKVGKEMADKAFDSFFAAAEFARSKSEEFVKTTYDMITDQEVQRHFMSMGMEFIAGLSALVDKSPLPDKLKKMASDVDSNIKDAACGANPKCKKKGGVQTIKINKAD